MIMLLCFLALLAFVFLPRRVMPALCVLAFLTILAPVAHAQGSSISEKDLYTAILQPILLAIASIVATVLLAVLYRANAWLKQKTGISVLEEDQAHRDALAASITNGAGLVLNQLGNKLDGKTIDVKDPVVKMGVDYVMKTAPDALQHFGLQDQANAIAEKIVAKLPQIANTTGAQS